MLKLLKFNIYLKCRHISGVSNFECDKISRFQQTPGMPEAAGMNLTATLIHTTEPTTRSLQRDMYNNIFFMFTYFPHKSTLLAISKKSSR